MKLYTRSVLSLVMLFILGCGSNPAASAAGGNSCSAPSFKTLSGTPQGSISSATVYTLTSNQSMVIPDHVDRVAGAPAFNGQGVSLSFGSISCNYSVDTSTPSSLPLNYCDSGISAGERVNLAAGDIVRVFVDNTHNNASTILTVGLVMY